jgi:hypothetical protein
LKKKTAGGNAACGLLHFSEQGKDRNLRDLSRPHKLEVKPRAAEHPAAVLLFSAIGFSCAAGATRINFAAISSFESN